MARNELHEQTSSCRTFHVLENSSTSLRGFKLIPAFRLLLGILGTAAYVGLAVLGWGGFAPFFSPPALIALAIALSVMAGASLFCGGKLGPRVGEGGWH